MDQPTVSTLALQELANALSMAVTMDFMSREHAALIWKKFIKLSGHDIDKKGGENVT